MISRLLCISLKTADNLNVPSSLKKKKKKKCVYDKPYNSEAYIFPGKQMKCY